MYDWRIEEGLEADDLMAIEQTKRPDETIICTRDKDLRQVPGWHYGWELGAQPQFGPLLVDPVGAIRLVRTTYATGSKSEIKGYGYLFFLSQCLTGDKVDTVPGLRGMGPVKAFEILEGTQSIQEGFNRVREAYRHVYGDDADKQLLEQGRLLWMVREIKDGKPVMWEFPN